MRATRAPQRPGTFARVLGAELRRLRNARGWTRQQLRDRLAPDLSLQGLATYELGTRQLSVLRLVELAEALEEPADQLLLRVIRQLRKEEGPTPVGFLVDLRVAAATTEAHLGPVRAWAQVRLATDSPSGHHVRLGWPAVQTLAGLCRSDPHELLRRLQPETPAQGKEA